MARTISIIVLGTTPRRGFSSDQDGRVGSVFNDEIQEGFARGQLVLVDDCNDPIDPECPILLLRSDINTVFVRLA